MNEDFTSSPSEEDPHVQGTIRPLRDPLHGTLQLSFPPAVKLEFFSPDLRQMREGCLTSPSKLKEFLERSFKRMICSCVH